MAEQESGYDKPDWVIKFPATKDGSEPFVIIAEFKQIIEKEYAWPFDLYTRWIDIGVAIGQGKMTMRQRLWTRVPDVPVEASNRKSNGMDPSMSSTETVNECDQRLANADDAG